MFSPAFLGTFFVPVAFSVVVLEVVDGEVGYIMTWALSFRKQ